MMLEPQREEDKVAIEQAATIAMPPASQPTQQPGI
jgi:hypothetical protein